MFEAKTFRTKNAHQVTFKPYWKIVQTTTLQEILPEYWKRAILNRLGISYFLISFNSKSFSPSSILIILNFPRSKSGSFASNFKYAQMTCSSFTELSKVLKKKKKCSRRKFPSLRKKSDVNESMLFPLHHSLIGRCTYYVKQERRKTMKNTNQLLAEALPSQASGSGNN